MSRPYLRYYNRGEPEKDHPLFPFTLFAVDGEDVEETCLRTSAVMRPDGPGAGLASGMVAQAPRSPRSISPMQTL